MRDGLRSGSSFGDSAYPWIAVLCLFRPRDAIPLCRYSVIPGDYFAPAQVRFPQNEMRTGFASLSVRTRFVLIFQRRPQVRILGGNHRKRRDATTHQRERSGNETPSRHVRRHFKSPQSTQNASFRDNAQNRRKLTSGQYDATIAKPFAGTPATTAKSSG